MSKIPAPLKYLFIAYFDDTTVIHQPEDDSYSKHVEGGRKTAFNDVLDHMKKAKLLYFDVNDGSFAYGIDLPQRRFGIQGTWFKLPEDEPLKDIRLEYFRTETETSIENYNFGYSGKNSKGERVLKTIRIE